MSADPRGAFLSALTGQRESRDVHLNRASIRARCLPVSSDGQEKVETSILIGRRSALGALPSTATAAKRLRLYRRSCSFFRRASRHETAAEVRVGRAMPRTDFDRLQATNLVRQTTLS